ISVDRRAAYVNVLLKTDPDNAPKLLPELERRIQVVPDLKSSVGGGPVFYEDIQSVSEQDLRRAELLAFPFALIALLLVFRSVVLLVVILAVLAAITLLPAILAILGLKVNAFPVRISRLWKRNASPQLNTVAVQSEAGLHRGFWYRLSEFVMRYPVRVFVPILLLLIGFGLPFLGVRFSAPDASILPPAVPSRAAFDLLASRFNGSETTPLLLAVQTKGNVLTPDNIRNLYYYVQRIEADP